MHLSGKACVRRPQGNAAVDECCSTLASVTVCMCEAGCNDWIHVAADLEHDMHLAGGLQVCVLWPAKGILRRQHHVQHHPARPDIRSLRSQTTLVKACSKRTACKLAVLPVKSLSHAFQLGADCMHAFPHCRIFKPGSQGARS